MQGEKIGELAGKVTGTRVLESDEGEGVKLEISYQAVGRLLGAETMELGTYVACPLPTGGLFGEGRGIAQTKEGEVITWRGNGVGKRSGKGLAASWRACIYYSSPSPKYARLTSVAGIVEWETSESGEVRGSVWEWK